MSFRKIAIITYALLLGAYPSIISARTNTVTTGLSMSYDIDDRQFETASTERDMGSEDQSNDNDSMYDYERFTIQPKIHFISDSKKDHFELKVAPTVKYDLIGSDTDWDTDLFLSGDSEITKSWQARGSTSFLRKDSADTSTGDTDDPQLSSDIGRSRYWQNSLKFGSKHLYGQQSFVDLGFDSTFLRYDDSDVDNLQDYDRYVVRLKNGHRFDTKWKSTANLDVTRGEYEMSEDELSDDLMEYRFLADVAYKSTRQHNVSLKYNYIGTRYDEALQEDGDIQQIRITSQYDFSRQLSVTLGGGPSYQKSEDRDANWGGNGIGELTYSSKHSSVNFSVEKAYDVENFSGTTQRGFVDYWDTRFSVEYALLAQLDFDGHISYRYEDREEPSTASQSILEGDDTLSVTEYHQDYYTTGVGLQYTFMQNYGASLRYTFTKKESEQIGEDYDDHRLLLTLSWNQEIYRW